MKEIELLAPAGNLEKMKTALQFGADAVYFGLPDFSLRARSNQFNKKDIITARDICKAQGKKFYITMNIYAHNVHLPKIEAQLKWIGDNKINPNGLIISDPGIIRLAKKYLPNTEIHLSTQANTTNIEAVKFWQEQGVSRIVLAREVTVGEIKEIHQAVPDMELEIFVHGAMCMSYSGRCILSKWMTNRSANLGDCAQPCRWKWNEKDNEALDIKGGYKTSKDVVNEEGTACSSCAGSENFVETELVDDKNRFGMKVEEDQHGTYMFNSYDISLIEHLEEIIDAGVVSLKVEGRAKSIYYAAVISRAYRIVLDAIKREEAGDKLKEIINEQVIELDKMSNRGYWTGFILGNEPPHLFDKASITVDWEFTGIAVDKDEKNRSGKKNNVQKVFVHNKLSTGDSVEVITAEKNIKSKIESIKNSDGENIESAHGGLGKIFVVEFSEKVPDIFLLRSNTILK